MKIGDKEQFRYPNDTQYPELIYTVFNVFQSELTNVDLLNGKCGTRICGGPVNKFKSIQESPK